MLQSSLRSNMVIRGIKLVDRAPKPAKIELGNGGIGFKQVTVTVTAPKGSPMDTKFIFYGDKNVSVQYQTIKTTKFNRNDIFISRLVQKMTNKLLKLPKH